MIADCNNHIRNNKVINPEQEFVSLRPGILKIMRKTHTHMFRTLLVSYLQVW